MSRPSLRGVAAVLALGAACAAGANRPAVRALGDAEAERASARELAGAGLRALVVDDDAATAARRLDAAVARDGRDPWARLGAALLARRSLDDEREATQLLALVHGAARHSLALVAARRLGDLAEISPPLAERIEAALGAALARGELDRLAALRARAARAAALAARGEVEAAERTRAEGGAVTTWTLSGPYSALHALDLERPFAPERGELPDEVPGAPGSPPVRTRAIPTPDGVLALEGEGPGGEIAYAAADLVLPRGGEYLLALGATASARAFLDGVPVVERRADRGFPPTAQVVPVSLRAGTHRLLVKVGRGPGRAYLGASLARADGAPADVRVIAAEPGSGGEPVRPAPLPRPVNGARDLARRLEAEVGPEVARLVAAADAVEIDREAAKALLEEALATAPRSAALLAARAEARVGDPTVAERIARGRAEADLDRALALDAGDAATRVARAELARAGGRLDDAAALLDGLAEADASRPRALVARARVAQARGLAPAAEGLAEEARRRGGDCAALELLQDLAVRRDAVRREDELASARAGCPGGWQRLADHRRKRGDLAGALAAADEAVRAAPARIEPRLARAGLLASVRGPRSAADDLAALAALWPRDPRIEKRRADLLDAAGEAAAARAARERALRLDGGDLALRRALALEEGKEPLDEVAEDGAKALAAYRAARRAYGSSSATVLDFGAVEAHPGGAYTERVHVLVEANDERAVDHVGEVSVPEGAELLRARTLKRDGRSLEPEEPLGDKRTLSLPGLEPGDLAEWEWIRSVPARGLALPGFTADAFFFRADTPLWRSVYVAVAPPGVPLEVDAHHMPPPGRSRDGGREIVRVERSDIPPLRPEAGAPGEAEYLPFVQVGAGAGTADLARAVADGALESFRPSLEVRALADDIAAAVTEGPTRPAALARAAYKKVNELVLGQGGSFSEAAGSILSRGRGSRTVLLKSVLDALGVPSRLALVRDFTRDPAPYRFARPDLYAYAVLRVEAGGEVAWVDPTTRGTPYGVLPPPLRGAEALVLPAPGEEVVVARTPQDEGRERRVTQLEVTVDAAGGATVAGVERYAGYDAAALRSSLERIDAQARREAVEAALSRTFRSPSLEALQVEGEEQPDGPLVLRWRARVERWARLEGARAVVDAPVFPARLGARFVQRAGRETPLLVAAGEQATLELVVNLPEGWTPVPAAPVEVASEFGRYHRSERGEAGRLRREDAYDLQRGRIVPAQYGAFSRFAASVDAAQELPITFARAATHGSARPGTPRS